MFLHNFIMTCLPGHDFDYIENKFCDPYVATAATPEPGMTGWAWVLLLSPIATIIIVVWCAVVMRLRENRVLAGPHPEDALVEIGGIKIRKSTIKLGVAAYAFKHDIAPHMGDGLRGANHPYVPDHPASPGRFHGDL